MQVFHFYESDMSLSSKHTAQLLTVFFLVFLGTAKICSANERPAFDYEFFAQSLRADPVENFGIKNIQKMERTAEGRKLDFSSIVSQYIDGLIEYIDELFPQKTKVQKLLKEENYSQAEKEIKIILEQDPTNIEYQKAYAAVLRINGKYEHSVEIYSKIIARFPRDMDSRLARGRSFLAMRDYQRALQDFNYVIKRQGDNPGALAGVQDVEKALQYEKQVEDKRKGDQLRDLRLKEARRLVENKSYSRAIEIYSALVRENGTDLEAKIYLASSLVLNHQIAEAKILYKSLKAKVPGNIEVLIGEGFLFARENDDAAAMENFQKAFRMDKNNKDAITGINLIKERIRERLRLEKIKAEKNKIKLLLADAESLIAAEKYAKAEELLSGAFPKYPQNTDIAFYLARVKVFQQKYGESFKLINNLIEANPNDLDYLNFRGRVYVATDRLEKAESDFRSVLAKNRDNKEATAGIRQIKNIKIQEIQKRFQKKKADYIIAQLALAKSFLPSENYRDAIRVYRETLDKYPNELEVQLSLARALTLNGDTDEAEQLYSLLARKFPRNSEIFVGRGYLYLRRGQLVLARNAFVDAQRIGGANDDADTGLLLVKERVEKKRIAAFISGEWAKADAFTSEGSFDKAIQIYNDVLNRYPDDLDTKIKLVRAYRIDSRVGGAEKILDDLMKAYPENPDLWIEKGQIQLLRGNPNLSAQSFSKALSLRPDDPEILNRLAKLKDEKEFNLLVKIVKSFESQKDYASAESQIRKKLRKDPEDVRAKYLLAQNFRFQERFDDSVEILNDLLSGDPDNVDYLASRGTVWRALDRPDDAKYDYEKALVRDPERIDLLLGRGYVSVMEKKFFEAEEYFKKALKLEPSDREAREATINIENFVRDAVIESFFVETFTKGRDSRITQNMEWVHPFNSKMRGNLGIEGVFVGSDADQTGFFGGNYDVRDDLNVRGKLSFSPNANIVAREAYETEVTKSFKERPLDLMFMYRFMQFESSSFHLISPGITYHFSEATRVLFRSYFGFQKNGNSRSGLININHKINPRLSVYFGGVIGNESSRLVSGVDTQPVDSKSVQAGFKWRVSDRFSFGLNYAHEEREGQSTRNMFGLVIPIRF